MKYIFPVFLVLIGCAMFVFAGYDDSPGGQLLGVLAVGYGLWRLAALIARKRRRV
ncbi:MAG TPA: hypothetical protein VD862_00995 [Candidatus Paceibacterota bacterium]|nr:hypothetical protein [Candidatus Paceibacterota bacterium]